VELFGQNLDSFVLAASLSPKAVVGELGCGSAPLCRLVAPIVEQAVAIDSSGPMLTAAKRAIEASCDVDSRDNIRLLQAELSATTLPDDYLDLAWLVLVLPYIEQPREVFQEAKRILKSGASLVVIDLLPHDRSNYRSEMGHLRQGVSEEQLAEWLSEAGLESRTYHCLPPDPQAKGPALFAAVANK
jgi:ArsR family transcriptional regulator